MTELLKNYVQGKWLAGTGSATVLHDPVLGTELVGVGNDGIDLAAAYAYARQTGGAALRALSYGQRAACLAKAVEVLKANRERYFDIALQNSGTTRNDSAFDIDGAIFTLGYYARLGAGLGQARHLLDGASVALDKAGSFRSRHLLVPARGMLLAINAFNFPAWGLWEKAAPALLSGVPVLVKPATVTAWLAQQMVADVVAAGVLPEGALSVVCGGSEGLLDPLQSGDLVSFTGSAHTAANIRLHPQVLQHGLRLNIEADSLNSALLAPGESAGSDSFEALARECVREMTQKSGQKCTAIRRIFVPAGLYDAVAEALRAKLAKISVGNPRNAEVRMGALVSRAQERAAVESVEFLGQTSEMLFDGSPVPLVDADPAVAACMAPYLLGLRHPAGEHAVHEVEVFGPVATLIAYRSPEEAFGLIRRGGGSLVTSVFGADQGFVADAAVELADSHGRVHLVTPAVSATHTGHGNVMPASLHGGPGRAGGGEELGGLRALNFYHRRCAVQAAADVVEKLDGDGANWTY